MLRVEQIPKARRALVGAIIAAVENDVTVDVRALAVRLGYTYNREFRLAWNSANSTLHANGGGFVPDCGKAACYVKATTPQKIRRSGRFRKAAARKVVRQHMSIAAADPTQLPEIERDGFARMVERNGAIASRTVALLTSRKSDDVPTLASAEVPRLPRGR